MDWIFGDSRGLGLEKRVPNNEYSHLGVLGVSGFLS